jgi:cell division septation protein DedD
MPSNQQSERVKLVVEPDDREMIGDDRPGSRMERDIDPVRTFGPADDIAADDEEDRPKGRGRFTQILAAFLVIALLVVVVWYAYNWGIGGIDTQELPLIRAEQGPIKSRPESPGGLEVPNQDKLVLNQMQPDPEKPQVERLLPPLETPKPPEAPAAAASSAEPQAPTAPPEPETESASATPPTPEPEPVAEAAPAVPSATPSTTQEVALPAAGAYVVQLASLKSRAGVDAFWARVQKAFPDLLGGRELAVQSVDLGSRGIFHRVQAGFFPDRASASALCASLKARKQDCLVTRR